MKKKAGRNIEAEKSQDPDCCTCAERKTCERYQENTFCTRWHSSDPEKRGIDPNEAWRRGDPAEF